MIIKYIFACFVLFIYCCKSSSDKQKVNSIEFFSGTYVLSNNPKISLTFNENHEFEYLNMSKIWDLKDRFYKTSGKWEVKDDKIFLNSSNNSTENSNAIAQIDSPENVKFSEFSFYDSNSDSVGFWYVKYSNGHMDANGADLRDGNFWWREDMTKTKSLEFTFSGYDPWKCISDGKNHNYRVVLYPIFKPGIFHNKILLALNNDTLIDPSNPKDSIFIKLISK